MQAAGLQPGGDIVNGQRSWTQRVPLLKSEIVGTPAGQRQLGRQATHLTQGEQIAVRAAQRRQAPRHQRRPMVFVGYGVKAPERGWDDFKGVDVKGKIIVMLVNDPDFEGGEGDFGGKAMTYYGRWTYKYEEAARQGAAGVLIVHETEPASYGWATVKNSNTNTMFDIVRQNPAARASAARRLDPARLAARCSSLPGSTSTRSRRPPSASDFQPVDLKATLTSTATPRPRSSPRTMSSASCPAPSAPTRR